MNAIEEAPEIAIQPDWVDDDFTHIFPPGSMISKGRVGKALCGTRAVRKWGAHYGQIPTPADVCPICHALAEEWMRQSEQ